MPTTPRAAPVAFLGTISTAINPATMHGMLKAEAVDLKQFPLYFDFNQNEKIDALINESIGRKVLNAVEEINTEFHQKIDALLYSLLDISDDIQIYIHDMFVCKFNERTKKSTT